MKTKSLLSTFFLLLMALFHAKAQDMASTPLTMEAVEPGSIDIVNPVGLTMEYSKNGGDWTSSSTDPISIEVAAGDVVQFRGDNASYGTFGESGELFTRFTATNPVYLYGNIMSLVSSTGFATLKEISDTSGGMGSNFGFLFSTPSGPGELFPKENSTIMNHPEKDIVLPATTLTNSCYMYLFSGCTKLTRAPELPATTLAEGCYHRLFDNCTSLEKAPVLPAKKLAGFCYSNMFAGCTKLNYVKCMATDITTDLCLDGWMEGVGKKGEFVKASTVNNYPIGESGIPKGWDVIDATSDDGDMGNTPFTMEAIENGTFTIVNPQKLIIQYNKNDAGWTSAYDNPITIEVEAGDKVSFRGSNASYCNEGSDATNFRSSGECYIYGNIMSLINNGSWPTLKSLTAPYAFANLFLANDDLSPNYTIKSHPYNELVLPATTLTNMCYSMMFQGCRAMTKAPALPATLLATFCYNDMFADCTGLTEAPELPATELAMGCYTMMFHGCTSLEKAPDLPARVLPMGAYDSMFMGCSKLSSVKTMATEITGYATTNWMDGVAPSGTFTKMSQMHSWPTGVDGIPEGWTVSTTGEADGDEGAVPLTLEAAADGVITISNPNGLTINSTFYHNEEYGYSSQYASFSETKSFEVTKGDKLVLTGDNAKYGNIDLTQATHISSTADVYVYGNVMSLVKSYDFASVTTLTEPEAFASLFGTDRENNTTIKNHPTKDIILGATTLTESCYAFMFAGCEGLTRAPELPATTLAPICYHKMFGNCTGLRNAPVLPATTLATECYFAMFDGCTNLRYVNCKATDLSAQDATLDWLKDVASTGTFVKSDGSEGWKTGTDGIPEGWSLSDTPLTIEATEDGTTIFIANPLGLYISYSTDGGANWESSLDAFISISDLAAGTAVQFKGMNDSYSTNGSTANSTIISPDKSCYIYGNIMSLVGGDEFASLTTLTFPYAFANLFSGGGNLINHPSKDLILPATTLSPHCYRYMFNGCSGLTKAPVLPATTMATRCYFGMFLSCTNLATAPELPSTKLATGCYTGMFYKCPLTEAPVLPATELTDYCYYQMFYSCSNLEKAPELPATYIPQSAYNMMFRNCTSLKEIPDLPASTVGGFGYNMMFRGCTGLTSYPTLVATELTGADSYQGMFWGCTNLKTAGDLKATSLGQAACQYMFSGCTSLEKAPALPAETAAPYCYNRMFEGCTSLVTAPELPATELAYLCYNDMFWECTALKNAPELKATTLTEYCYTMMFYGCTSLEKAPELPAEHIPAGAYEHMFMGCTSLNYVKCLATSIEDESATQGWLSNVAETGTFEKAAGMESWSTGKDESGEVNGIPEGWTVVDVQSEQPGKKGDVDGDGLVNITDVVKAINIIAAGGFDEKADINGDKSINITDIVMIINIIAKGE